MRRLFVLAALLAIVCCGKAQNVQLHYDFGGALYDKDLHGRPVLTSTVEMFKADKWGSTYFFCRHGLYQQRCCSRLLGDCPRTAFLATSFFHTCRI